MDNQRFRPIELQVGQRRSDNKIQRWSTQIDRGFFYMADIPPGDYEIECVKGYDSVYQNSSTICFAPENKNNPTQINISTPGIYFWGPWNYLAKNPLSVQFNSNDLILGLASEPNPKETVRKFLFKLESTRWYKTAKDYLTQ